MSKRSYLEAQIATVKSRIDYASDSIFNKKEVWKAELSNLQYKLMKQTINILNCSPYNQQKHNRLVDYYRRLSFSIKFHNFRDLSLIGFHFSPVPNCSGRKPFIRSQYLNCLFPNIFLYICGSKLNHK